MQTTTGHVAPTHDDRSLSYPLNETSSKYSEHSSSRRVTFLTQISTAKDVNQVIKALEELREHMNERYSHCCYCFLMSNHFLVSLRSSSRTSKIPLPSLTLPWVSGAQQSGEDEWRENTQSVRSDIHLTKKMIQSPQHMSISSLLSAVTVVTCTYLVISILCGLS